MLDNNKPTRVIVPFIDSNSGIVAVYIHCDVSAVANCLKTDLMMYYYISIIILFNIIHNSLIYHKKVNKYFTNRHTSHTN